MHFKAQMVLISQCWSSEIW